MARGMGLTLLLMVSSMAAAVAAPGVMTPWFGSACSDVKPAMRAPDGRQAPASATRLLPARPEAAECDADPSRVYRHWHHGGTKLGAGCQPFTDPPALLAQGG